MWIGLELVKGTSGHTNSGNRPLHCCMTSVVTFSVHKDRMIQAFDGYWALPPKKCPFPRGSGPHLIHGSSGPQESPQTAHQSVRPFFAQPTHVPNRETDIYTNTRPCYVEWNVCSNRLHLCTARK